MIFGTPGSGKTTIARLFQYQTLRTLLRNQEQSSHKSLVDALVKCRAIFEGRAAVAACRLPLEAEYREFWEFPYPDELKNGLMIGFLQARAVLGWLRSLQAGGHSLDEITIVPRADAEASRISIGGTDPRAMLERARQIELSIYRASAALVPPDVSALGADAVAAYRPLDVISEFRVVEDGVDVALRPLLILDDAHNLHPSQLAALKRWLSRRELPGARWILTRLDALTPAEVLTDSVPEGGDDEPGLKKTREITEIWLQSTSDRTNQRRSFRRMAKDMANQLPGPNGHLQAEGLEQSCGYSCGRSRADCLRSARKAGTRVEWDPAPSDDCRGAPPRIGGRGRSLYAGGVEGRRW